MPPLGAVLVPAAMRRHDPLSSNSGDGTVTPLGHTWRWVDGIRSSEPARLLLSGSA
jgi:hypothetical protein